MYTNGVLEKSLIIGPIQNVISWILPLFGPYLSFLLIIIIGLLLSSVYLFAMFGSNANNLKKFLADPFNYIPPSYEGETNSHPLMSFVILVLVTIVSFAVIWVVYRGFLVPQIWGWPVPEYIQAIGRYIGVGFGQVN